MTPSGLFGILAKFSGPEALIEATDKAYQAGYRRMEAYTPYPVHGLPEAMRFERTWLPLVVLIGGIVGACSGYALQYWVSVIAYPHNVGGRPFHTWPMFIPVTFEMTILVAAISGVLGMLALNGLPRPHHPLFAIPQFEAVSRDGFFLLIPWYEEKYDEAATRDFMKSLQPEEVMDVPF